MYHYVGHLYHGHMIYEGKITMDDLYLVVDEYLRPGMHDSHDVLYCLLLCIRTQTQHEVWAGLLRRGNRYRRVG